MEYIIVLAIALCGFLTFNHYNHVTVIDPFYAMDCGK